MTNHRILLYGASNLWLSRRAALTALRRRFQGSLEIGLALGPGRSYGLRAGNPLVRYVPLQEVEFDFGAPVNGHKIAFITDVGNDIAYSQPPERIVGWVGSLAQKLHNQGYQVMVGGIPTKSLRTIDPRLFAAVARLYYPQGGASLALINRNLEELELRLQDLCAEQGYPYCDLETGWYSYDRFHLRRASRDEYWSRLLAPFPERAVFTSTWSVAIRRPFFPARYWLAGREFHGGGEYRALVPDGVVRVR